jgi:hypothetical protein
VVGVGMDKLLRYEKFVGVDKKMFDVVVLLVGWG